MEKLVNFEVDELEKIDFDNYSNEEFAIARMGFLSTKPNAHELKISEEVLRDCAKTVLDKWVVADMQFGEPTTHTKNEHIVGKIPKDQSVEFIYDENGYLRAYVDTVISKIYAKDFCEAFAVDTSRAVSVEMKVEVSESDEDEVVSFNIVGVTVLGKTVLPSCPDSDISMIRFSQEDADAYFNKMNDHNLTPLKKFAKERIANMAKEDYVNHPISTSKEDIYEGEWDGQKVKQDLVKEKNFKSLAPKVCMKLEEGWEDREVTKLGYPVMMLYDGKWVYSTKGLSSALGYAKKENETTVVNKIEKIYKKLGLDDGKEVKSEMAEVEFSAVNIGDMWSRIWDIIDQKREWDYSISGIYEEDNQKFAILKNRDQNLYRLNFTLTEEGLTASDEVIEVKQDFIDTDNIRKFSEPENVEQYQKFAEVEPEKKEMSLKEAMDKIANLESEIEKRDNIIMENEKSMKEKDIELSDLRTFKQTCMEVERGSKVEAVMSEVSKFMDKTQAEESRKEGLTCEFSAVDAWANKVKASVFDKMSKASTKEGDFTRMSAPVEIKKTGSVWDRL